MAQTNAAKKSAPEKSEKSGSTKVDCPKLKKIIAAKKLTIAALAHLSNLYYTPFKKIVSGKTQPRPKTLKAICKALGVSEKAVVKASGER